MPKTNKIIHVTSIDCEDQCGAPITVLRLKQLIDKLRDSDFIELSEYMGTIEVYRKETQEEYEERIKREKADREEKARQQRLKQYLKLKEEFEKGETQ